MDIKRYLLEQIKKCKRKMNIAKLIDYGILFSAAGGICGVLCELLSLVIQFYYAHLAAALCFAAGFLAGIGYALYKRSDMGHAARRLDSFGLKERIITAYEQMDKENEFAQIQRQDAFFHYNQIRGQIKISLVPDKRHILALLISVIMVIGMGFIPSSVREQARVHHQVQKEADKELKKLDELIEALEKVDMESLTEEQKRQLREMTESMELSREELAKAASWESLASAGERLDYKYDQARRNLESLAAQMENPEEAGIASAEALAKAAANKSGYELAASKTPDTNSGGDSKDADESGGTGSGEGSEAGKASGEGDGQSNNGNQENGSGQGSGNGQDSGNGNGQGQGTGQGNGTGNGNGSGSGDGNGQGSGRGTGSSNTTHDYVSIPNLIGDDASLTGDKNGNQNSDYYRQQNGLAWEGTHVDYNSVIGEYTDNAYEGIANGRYPSGMEPVIRDYFENLNK